MFNSSHSLPPIADIIAEADRRALELSQAIQRTRELLHQSRHLFSTLPIRPVVDQQVDGQASKEIFRGDASRNS